MRCKVYLKSLTACTRVTLHQDTQLEPSQATAQDPQMKEHSEGEEEDTTTLPQSASGFGHGETD